MTKHVIGAIGLLLVMLRVGLAQPIERVSRKPIHCQGLEEPPKIDKLVNGVLSSRMDSVALKQETEATYQLMAGRWNLFQVQGGWGGPKEPNRQIELVIDNRGQSSLYEAGKIVGAFAMQLIRNWDSYQSSLNPKGQSLFSQYCRKLDIELCKDTLVLIEGRGDGLEYVFKRTVAK